MTPAPNENLHQMVAQIFLEVTALRSEVQQLRSEIAGQTQPEGWAPPTEAAAALKTEAVKNARHLQKIRLDGAFSEKHGEIRNVSPGDRPTWEYHIPKCKIALRRHFKRIAG